VLTTDFDYFLPKELIAQSPVEPRDQARLLVMDKEHGTLAHRTFKDILDYLSPEDVLVINNTKVLPARLLGLRRDTGGKVEVFAIRNISGNKWEAQVKASGNIRAGEIIDFGLAGSAEYVKKLPNGLSIVILSSERILEEHGLMPLPPYIKQDLKRPDRYQTVYAKHLGSAAAPTAGLHFTDELLTAVKSQGVTIAEVTLHVGVDTFRPVHEDDPINHEIHKEYWYLSDVAADAINTAKIKGGKVICVGTTTVRLLEHAASLSDGLPMASGSGMADLYILPGFPFKITDAMITNFHLPCSTLLMLVSAFSSREHIIGAYQEAINKKYRFYSFGDAMFIH